jgi:hypothetical protein
MTGEPLECRRIRINVLMLNDFPTDSDPYKTSGLKIKNIYGKKLVDGSFTPVVVSPFYRSRSFLFLPDDNLIFICVQDFRFVTK